MNYTWPMNDDPGLFYRLADAVRNALDQAYIIRRKIVDGTPTLITWNGPPTMQEATAEYLLSPEHLAYSDLPDAMDEIIGIAIQLGIEQGRRTELKRQTRGW